MAGKEPLDTRPTGDPAQAELGLSVPGRFVWTDLPWQAEMVFRVVLDGGVIAAVVVVKGGLFWLVRLARVETSWVEAVLVSMFNISLVVTAACMVAFDLTRFVVRRAPTSWKQRVLTWWPRA